MREFSRIEKFGKNFIVKHPNIQRLGSRSFYDSDFRRKSKKILRVV